MVCVKKLLALLLLLLVPTLVLGSALIVSNKPLNTGTAEYQLLAGNAFYLNGEFESAIGHYKAAIELDPENLEALNNLAVSLNKQEEYADAANYLKMLAELDPLKATHHYDYATNIILNIKKHNYGTPEELEIALSEYKKADSLSPGILKVKENIAFVEDLLARYYAKKASK